MNKSAYVRFSLQPSFFCRWRPMGNIEQQRRGIQCQLLVKSMLAGIGKPASLANVERLDLKIVDNDQVLYKKAPRDPGAGEEEDESDDDLAKSIEAVLVMKLVCDYGITKRHSLYLQTSDFPRPEVNPDSTPSGFTIDGTVIQEWLKHFDITLTSASTTSSSNNNVPRPEHMLNWMFSNERVKIRSSEGVGGQVTTTIDVSTQEFEDYEVVDGRVDLTLPMREFRAAFQLAEQMHISLTVCFSDAGQPLTINNIDEDISSKITIFCAIATTICTAFDDDNTTPNPHRSRPSTRRPTSTSNPSSHQNGNPRKRPVSDDPTQHHPSSRRLRLSTLPMASTSSQRVNEERGRLFMSGGSQEVNGGEKQFVPPPSQEEIRSQVAAAGFEDLDAVVKEMGDVEEEEELEEDRPPDEARPEEEREVEYPGMGDGVDLQLVWDLFAGDNPNESIHDVDTRPEMDEVEELDEDEIGQGLGPTQAPSNRPFRTLFDDD
ncbi:hypothetical protein TREMEDRAFT_60659 [Tremella mesenterica DSM 1558]|uniref:uncharacterized protein n=1 Tax=Tremella mesenterica (strain ATCC 24925 / CBS 8224 / DSM 1558 / NBRC 9311 / NRRL Y-6157 / RJB 2259-6 / UBC 559-6) TaxID=578456 RepID=UPI0003F4934A|nr:uncharacterized protein TREMEDRAFT_60659 [Tremella mesenterica DSM 1558]EIW71745.1 hypothetical protein TREMEDRAFT_60659 [Tremella mesenterica DSM 1558]